MASRQENFIRRLRERLGRAHDGFFIGCFDWSLNERRKGKPQPRWCPHVHAITSTGDEDALKKSLKEQFPKSDRVLKPVSVKPWDGNGQWFRYSMRGTPERARRIETTGERFDPHMDRNRKCRDTDHQPLRSKEKLEYLLHLDSIGFTGRLVLRNVQFVGGDRPTFRDVRAKSRMHDSDENDDWADS